MDIRGLRIGNIVCSNGQPMNTYNGQLCRVTSIDSLDSFQGKQGTYIGSVGLETNYLWKGDTIGAWVCFVEPEPLSEKILFKLGFKKEEEEVTHVYEYNLCANNHFIRIGKYSNTLGRDYNIHIDNQNRDSVSCTDIQYLHQLQNAIFDATGEELNVNELLK